uniref:Uncharacterized protein n=1 Tax=Suricata suricatta TaxID=37032 RepID=A0A673UC19_SURSU
MHLNIIMAIYDKPTANIMINGEMVKAFPLRSERRQWHPLSPLLFIILLEVLARQIRQKEEIKGNFSKWKRRSKIFSADDLILYTKSLMTIPRNC